MAARSSRAKAESVARRDIAGIVIDITDRKRAEEGLRIEKARAQEYLNIAGVILLALDADGNITLLNRKGYEALGYPQGSLLGQNWFETCLPERERARLALPFRELAAGHIQAVAHFENAVLTRSGGERLVEWHNTAIFDQTGSLVCTLSSGEDVTDRRRKEDELRQLSDRLSLAAGAANVGIWDHDLVTNEVVWDAAMLRIYNIAPEDFGGTYEAWKARVHPNDQLQTDQEVQAALRGEKDLDVEFRLVWPDRSVRYVKANAVVQRDPLGKPVRILGTNWDITNRKRAELHIEHLNEVLHAIRDIGELIVRERNAERLLAEACNTLVRTRGYRLVWIGGVAPGSKRVTPLAGAGPAADYLDAAAVTWDDCETGRGPVGTALRRAADPRVPGYGR